MRYVYAIGGLLLLVGILGFIKFSQISMLIGMGKKMEKDGPPPEVVVTTVAHTQQWEGTVSAVGSIASVKGVPISNDAPGVVTRVRFESGAMVNQGDVLVELDTSVEQAQIAAAKVRKELAQVTAERTRKLLSTGAEQKSAGDVAESQLKSAAADIDLLQAQIARKIVRAPFKGRLGIRAVNVGQYLNPGTNLTVLEAADGVYVDFTLPQQQPVAIGAKVRVTIEGAPEANGEGTVVAIDPTIDATSRMLKLRASLPNKDDKLRPGMFANVSLVLPPRPSEIVVPLTAVIYASYGSSVFVAEPLPAGTPATTANGETIKNARQQFVRLGERRGDFVAILDGVKDNDELVTEGAFKLRNNSHIVIGKAAMKPELAPRPVNH